MSGTRPSGGNPAALALITAVLIGVIGWALVQRQENRPTPPAPSATATATATATAVAVATVPGASAYPRCADAAGRGDCVALMDGGLWLVSDGAAPVPVVMVAEVTRDGVRWVTVRA